MNRIMFRYLLETINKYISYKTPNDIDTAVENLTTALEEQNRQLPKN